MQKPSDPGSARADSSAFDAGWSRGPRCSEHERDFRAVTSVAATKSEATIPQRCRSCNRPLRSVVVCEHCHALHSVETLSHFEVFGLEPAYDLDAGQLRQRYLQLARFAHPDRAGTSDDPAAGLAMRISAQLNRAVEVLSDPVERAGYLLELFGGPSAAEDKSVPQEVLLETMELREQIEEAAAQRDAARLAEIGQRVRGEHDEMLERIAALARRLPGDEALRRELRLRLNGIRYYQKMLEQIEAAGAT